MRKIETRSLAALAMLLAALVGISSCATNPVSGYPQLMLLSEEDERALGGKTDKQVVGQYGIYDNPPLTAYVGDVCMQMGRLSHRPGLSYEFRILDTPVVNAFAVPGGYVYFTRGIVAALSSEAEMAGIMGHELGHITARHSAEQYSRAQLAQVGLGLGMMLGGPIGRSLGGLAELGVGMLFLSFSRENEREADRLGVEYSSRAGYDAGEMARFFETLERMQPKADNSGLPSWFSTHPSPDDREEAVRRDAAAWQRRLNLSRLKVARNSYLKRIDGLIYGENPREGFVEANVFYHPDLRFRFPVPKGWKIQNTRTLVRMVSENKEAAILFNLSRETSPEQAAGTFVEKSKVTVLESGPKIVSGLPAYALTSGIRTRQGGIQILSYFILYEGRVYEFHGLSSPDKFADYLPSFKKTMARFRPLTDPKRLNVKPDRIRIRSAGVTGSLEAALRKQGIKGKGLEKAAILNGMHLDDPVRPDTLIKVVEKGR
ncbi:MAG: M48 family metalloprotease [Deltaproteobacteria bacterium]|nr:M48 family metalloprotease [Deltaproteobacteria bacterium]